MCLDCGQSGSQGTTSTSMDPAIRDALLNYYGNQQKIQGAADANSLNSDGTLKKIDPYTGELTAGLTQAQTDAIKNQSADTNASKSAYDNAQQIASQTGQYQNNGAGPASQTTGQGYGASGYTGQGWNAVGYDGTGYTAQNMQAAQLGPAAQSATERAQAALASVDKLGNTNLAPYQDPYTQQVVDATQNQFLHDSALNAQQSQATATQQGAFGGSGQGIFQAQNQDNINRNLASTLAGLNTQGFETAKQGAQFDIANQLQANLANSGQLNDLSKFNAQTGTENNQFNAGQTNQFALTQAQMQQQANAANQAAGNTASQFTAGNQQQAGLATQAAQNASRQSVADATNASNQYNATAQNSANQFSANANNTASLANQQANNNMAQFNNTAGFDAAGLRAGAANTLGNLGSNISATNNANNQTLMALGTVQQNTNQAADTSAYNNNYTMPNFTTPQFQMSMLNAGQGQSPNGNYGVTQSSNNNKSGGSCGC